MRLIKRNVAIRGQIVTMRDKHRKGMLECRIKRVILSGRAGAWNKLYSRLLSKPAPSVPLFWFSSGTIFGAKVAFALTFQPHPISVFWPPNWILQERDGKEKPTGGLVGQRPTPITIKPPGSYDGNHGMDFKHHHVLCYTEQCDFFKERAPAAR